ncbi:hypothetical protein L1080_003385 [Rhodococcus sp. MSC1_016]|uniref:hypothetical protein n=1 Tax=Rhodococcus sp. MSC1_016 TaxID=2909266 RepID=UPI00202DD68F|nr:hypothetical protein [Rhodococcus sp. MSC1_016]
MEHLPRRVPAGDINLVDYLVPMLQEFVGDVPIIGDLIEILSGVEDGNLNDVGTWVNDLTSGLGTVQQMVNQIADIINGLVVTPINNAVQGVKDWFADLLGFRSTTTTNVATAQSSADTAYSNANAAYTLALTADQAAGDAVDTAEEAANQAAAAVETADIAYDNASYWEAECVVSSADVLLGVNELLIGLCQNVPTGKTRKITDIHIALQSQPGGMVLQTKKWNAAGTSNSVIHTATLSANQTRASYSNLNIDVTDKERVFWNVSTITGSVSPTVLQVAVFGAIL